MFSITFPPRSRAWQFFVPSFHFVASARVFIHLLLTPLRFAPRIGDNLSVSSFLSSRFLRPLVFDVGETHSLSFISHPLPFVVSPKTLPRLFNFGVPLHRVTTLPMHVICMSVCA